MATTVRIFDPFETKFKAALNELGIFDDTVFPQLNSHFLANPGLKIGKNPTAIAYAYLFNRYYLDVDLNINEENAFSIAYDEIKPKYSKETIFRYFIWLRMLFNQTIPRQFEILKDRWIGNVLVQRTQMEEVFIVED